MRNNAWQNANCAWKWNKLGRPSRQALRVPPKAAPMTWRSDKLKPANVDHKAKAPRACKLAFKAVFPV